MAMTQLVKNNRTSGISGMRCRLEVQIQVEGNERWTEEFAREKAECWTEEWVEEEKDGPGRSKYSRLKAYIKYDICLLNL